ncbi:nucleotidyltransferase family protein [Thiocapsa rosea]|uniref:glucose-1-phosphate thymidylyltransferase n=1 Tax=Thiocapsa rosea TaxID=69360 RepID=A0A495VHY0_9GAMM|nr:sugar phosphate nucleotidyltransferase [Thiocapsa rosea]RKT47468.1 glucose-1-phosphate thymidylyltransferase [Thiocapsa rosea]
MTNSFKAVALIPAAGHGTRLSPLPMSKELFPIGFAEKITGSERSVYPKVACHYLLDGLRAAGITEGFFILRPSKWDIPNYFGDGSAFGMRLAYLTVHVPFGVPFSLDQAYPFIQQNIVALGFPDILISPEGAHRTLLKRLIEGNADIVLGLFPTDEPHKVGVVDLGSDGQVVGIYEKSNHIQLRYMWAIAVWRPSFTRFLHEFVERQLKLLIGVQPSHNLLHLPVYKELSIGDVMHSAIHDGMRVEAEIFSEGHYIDIGTPENLIKAIRSQIFDGSDGR